MHTLCVRRWLCNSPCAVCMRVCVCVCVSGGLPRRAHIWVTRGREGVCWLVMPSSLRELCPGYVGPGRRAVTRGLALVRHVRDDAACRTATNKKKVCVRWLVCVCECIVRVPMGGHSPSSLGPSGKTKGKKCKFGLTEDDPETFHHIAKFRASATWAERSHRSSKGIFLAIDSVSAV